MAIVRIESETKTGTVNYFYIYKNSVTANNGSPSNIRIDEVNFRPNIVLLELYGVIFSTKSICALNRLFRFSAYRLGSAASQAQRRYSYINQGNNN